MYINEEENKDEEDREELDMKPAATIDNIQIDEDEDQGEITDSHGNQLPDVVPNQPELCFSTTIDRN